MNLEKEIFLESLARSLFPFAFKRRHDLFPYIIIHPPFWRGNKKTPDFRRGQSGPIYYSILDKFKQRRRIGTTDRSGPCRAASGVNADRAIKRY